MQSIILVRSAQSLFVVKLLAAVALSCALVLSYAAPTPARAQGQNPHFQQHLTEPSPAGMVLGATTFTESQVQSIIALLRSFKVPQTILEQVEVVLRDRGVMGQSDGVAQVAPTHIPTNPGSAPANVSVTLDSWKSEGASTILYGKARNLNGLSFTILNSWTTLYRSGLIPVVGGSWSATVPLTSLPMGSIVYFYTPAGELINSRLIGTPIPGGFIDPPPKPPRESTSTATTYATIAELGLGDPTQNFRKDRNLPVDKPVDVAPTQAWFGVSVHCGNGAIYTMDFGDGAIEQVYDTGRQGCSGQTYVSISSIHIYETAGNPPGSIVAKLYLGTPAEVRAGTATLVATKAVPLRGNAGTAPAVSIRVTNPSQLGSYRGPIQWETVNRPSNSGIAIYFADASTDAELGLIAVVTTNKNSYNWSNLTRENSDPSRVCFVGETRCVTTDPTKFYKVVVKIFTPTNARFGTFRAGNPEPTFHASASSAPFRFGPAATDRLDFTGYARQTKNLTASPAGGRAPIAIEFSGAFTDLCKPVVGLQYYTIDFGDGTSVGTSLFDISYIDPLRGANCKIISFKTNPHLYKTAGTFNVKLYKGSRANVTAGTAELLGSTKVTITGETDTPQPSSPQKFIQNGVEVICAAGGGQAIISWPAPAEVGAIRYAPRLNDLSNDTVACAGKIDGWYCPGSNDWYSDAYTSEIVTRPLTFGASHMVWVHTIDQTGAFGPALEGPTFSCTSTSTSAAEGLLAAAIVAPTHIPTNPESASAKMALSIYPRKKAPADVSVTLDSWKSEGTSMTLYGKARNLNGFRLLIHDPLTTYRSSIIPVVGDSWSATVPFTSLPMGGIVEFATLDDEHISFYAIRTPIPGVTAPAVSIRVTNPSQLGSYRGPIQWETVNRPSNSGIAIYFADASTDAELGLIAVVTTTNQNSYNWSYLTRENSDPSRVCFVGETRCVTTDPTKFYKVVVKIFTPTNARFGTFRAGNPEPTFHASASSAPFRFGPAAPDRLDFTGYARRTKNLTASPAGGRAPIAIEFSGAFTDLCKPVVGLQYYTIDFGDGTSVGTSLFDISYIDPLRGANCKIISFKTNPHLYKTAGTFNVKLYKGSPANVTAGTAELLGSTKVTITGETDTPQPSSPQKFIQNGVEVICAAGGGQAIISWPAPAGVRAIRYAPRLNDLSNDTVACAGKIDGWYCPGSNDWYSDAYTSEIVTRPLTFGASHMVWVHTIDQTGAFGPALEGPTFSCTSTSTSAVRGFFNTAAGGLLAAAIVAPFGAGVSALVDFFRAIGF